MSDSKGNIVTSLKSFFMLQNAFLDNFLKCSDDALLKKRFFELKWSAWEQFCHIVRYQEMFAARISDILEGKNPYYDAYQPDTDTIFLNFKNSSLHILLSSLEESARVIHNSICKQEPHLETMQGTHAKFGILNAKEWVEFFMLHALHHWYDVQKQVLLNRK